MDMQEYIKLLKEYDVFRIKLMLKYVGIVFAFSLSFLLLLMLIFLPDWQSVL